MRNPPPDKYNVAWFKLAECVSRGEKERALGVYRLLAHSLNDSAFARQLQGDILLSFHDTAGAVEHYTTAASLYQKDDRLLEAAAVYEHILILVTDKRDFLVKLVELYTLLQIPSKLLTFSQALAALLLAQGDLTEVLALIDLLDLHSDDRGLLAMRQQLVVAWAHKGDPVTPVIEEQIKKIIASLLAGDEPAALQRFLTMLQAFPSDYYKIATAMVQDGVLV